MPPKARNSRRHRVPPLVRPRNRGYFQIEVLFGIIVVAALLAALCVAAGQQEKALRQMADKRAALRRMETFMTALQTGEPPNDSTVQMLRLNTASPAPTQAWIQLSTPWRHQTLTLVGLVPTKWLNANPAAPAALEARNAQP